MTGDEFVPRYWSGPYFWQPVDPYGDLPFNYDAPDDEDGAS